MVDAGSKLLKAGFAIPDQAPSMVTPDTTPLLFLLRLFAKRSRESFNALTSMRIQIVPNRV